MKSILVSCGFIVLSDCHPVAFICPFNRRYYFLRHFKISLPAGSGRL